MKRKLQISILLLGLLTIYFACQKDDAVTTQQNIEQRIPKIKTVSYQEVGETFNRLTNKYQLDVFLDVGLDDNYLAKTTIDTLGITIYVDNIKEVSLDDYVSYTLLVATPNSTDSMFYNITIEDKNGETGIILTKYEPTQTWLADTSQKYEGHVEAKRFYDITRIGEELDDGGGGWNNTSYTEPSLEYPWDCEGLIITSYQSVTLCNCHNHIPEICGGCPYGYRDEELPHYLCVTMNDGNDDVLDTGTTDPVDTSNPNDGGPNGGSTEDDDNDSSYTALVDPTWPPGKIRNLEGKCVCVEGKVEDTDGNCICPEGYIENDRGECILENNYDDLKELTDVPEVKTKLWQLKTDSGSFEKGLRVNKHPQTDEYVPSPVLNNNNGTNHISILPQIYTSAIAHTHPNDVAYKMFSGPDVLKLAQMANVMQTSGETTVEPLEITHIIVFENTAGDFRTYALRFDDTQSLQRLQVI